MHHNGANLCCRDCAERRVMVRRRGGRPRHYSSGVSSGDGGREFGLVSTLQAFVIISYSSTVLPFSILRRITAVSECMKTVSFSVLPEVASLKSSTLSPRSWQCGHSTISPTRPGATRPRGIFL